MSRSNVGGFGVDPFTTFTVAVTVLSPNFAVTNAVPSPTGVTTPSGLTETMPAGLAEKVASRVRSAARPPLVSVTISRCRVSLPLSVMETGETARSANAGAATARRPNAASEVGTRRVITGGIEAGGGAGGGSDEQTHSRGARRSGPRRRRGDDFLHRAAYAAPLALTRRTRGLSSPPHEPHTPCPRLRPGRRRRRRGRVPGPEPRCRPRQ